MTLTDIVRSCENDLGWAPPRNPDVPEWKVMKIEVAKLKAAMKTNPSKHTVKNLGLALEYSRRKQMKINTPRTLLARIDEALELADTAPVHDLTQRVAAAVAWEYATDDEHTMTWLSRLIRSVGPFREEALAEWKAAGRGV